MGSIFSSPIENDLTCKTISYLDNYTNLIFEGGSSKGIAYIGVLEVLTELDILKNIKKVGGTSIGSVFALLVVLGYNVDEIKKILMNINMTELIDYKHGYLDDTIRLAKHYGTSDGQKFKNLILK